MDCDIAHYYRLQRLVKPPITDRGFHTFSRDFQHCSLDMQFVILLAHSHIMLPASQYVHSYFNWMIRLTVLHAPIHVQFVLLVEIPRFCFWSWRLPNMSRLNFFGTWRQWMRTSHDLLQRLFFPNGTKSNFVRFISSRNHRISSSHTTSTLSELIVAWPAASSSVRAKHAKLLLREL